MPMFGKPSGGVSFDLKEKRASEIVRMLRRPLDLPTIGEPMVATAPSRSASTRSPKSERPIRP